MIFLWGSGIYYVFLGVLVVLFAVGSMFTSWLAQNSLGVTAILLVAWGLHTFCTLKGLRLSHNRTPTLVIGLLHCLPQVAVILLSYPYFLREIDSLGAGSASLDYIVVLGIYFALGMLWSKVIVRDRAGPLGVILLSALHFAFSFFLICGFLFL